MPNIVPATTTPASQHSTSLIRNTDIDSRVTSQERSVSRKAVRFDDGAVQNAVIVHLTVTNSGAVETKRSDFDKAVTITYTGTSEIVYVQKYGAPHVPIEARKTDAKTVTVGGTLLNRGDSFALAGNCQ